MAQYVDCYWLINSRDNNIAERFLNKILQERVESSSDYPVPIYSNNPSIIYSNVQDIMLYLGNHPNEEYSIYWRNCDKKSEYKHAVIIYTDDGKMIFGASLEGNDPYDKIIESNYVKIKNFLGANFGCITVEEMAPTNSLYFTDFCKKRHSP